MMDGKHALLTGRLVGMCMREEDFSNLLIETDSDGNYQNSFYIDRPEGRYRILVEAPGTYEDIIEI